MLKKNSLALRSARQTEKPMRHHIVEAQVEQGKANKSPYSQKNCP